MLFSFFNLEVYFINVQLYIGHLVFLKHFFCSTSCIFVLHAFFCIPASISPSPHVDFLSPLFLLFQSHKMFFLLEI